VHASNVVNKISRISWQVVTKQILMVALIPQWFSTSRAKETEEEYLGVARMGVKHCVLQILPTVGVEQKIMINTFTKQT
jgi:hypothetical protein